MKNDALRTSARGSLGADFLDTDLVDIRGSYMGDIAVVGYYRSGNNWLADMLAFASNGNRKNFHQIFGRRHEYDRHIYQHHYPPKHGRLKNKKIVTIVRDPRDVAISMRYYFAKCPDNKTAIDYMMGTGGVNWAEFVNAWLAEDAPMVRYKDLHKNAVGELARLFDEIGVDIERDKIAWAVGECTMSKSKKRNSKRKNFYRKGIVGDWKNHLTTAQNQRCLDAWGDTMRRLGFI